ncbi:S66 family peptidase [Actinospica robiniae]|uniref:S66 family peptidase n=1 Tax=Actinospica robiniae TaxID=304901 RepID=UPI0004288F79|nr:S66 peptidase family protein [Actinospica robiniae]
MRFPLPLRLGDRIAVTSPSSGVPDALRARLRTAIQTVEAYGYEVMVGECMDGTGHVSADAPKRARELTALLTDPSVRAVVPPWGGETAIDLLELLDWPAIMAAEPTWLVGFSDMSTILTPLTLRTGIATIHGNNLMDTPYRAPEGLLTWLDLAAAGPGATLRQDSPGRYRAEGFDDYRKNPGVRELTLDTPGRWIRLDRPEPVEVTGRLIGGCIETLCHTAGTRYGDVAGFAREHAPEGLIVYVEAASDDAFTICRSLHGMRLAGFFTNANAVLVGRTRAADAASLTQHQAVLDALSALDVPIIADVECGHVVPYMPVVNGALARLTYSDTENSLTQTLA